MDLHRMINLPGVTDELNGMKNAKTRVGAGAHADVSASSEPYIEIDDLQPESTRMTDCPNDRQSGSPELKSAPSESRRVRAWVPRPADSAISHPAPASRLPHLAPFFIPASVRPAGSLMGSDAISKKISILF
jgi:hypothetical protein